MTTPQAGAPAWIAAQAHPWVQSNIARRIFDGFSYRTSVLDRDLTAPPGTCADGARYLVAASATGAWAGKDGKLAIASGVNAADGWNFADVAREGVEIWVEDEAAQIEHNGAAWALSATPKTRLQDMDDVDVTGMTDGQILKWDASNGVFYGADDLTGNDAPFRGALVRMASNQTTADYNPAAVVAWDQEVYDTDNIHDTVTNNSQLVVPSGVSYVRVLAQVECTLVNASEVVEVAIYKNGSRLYDGVAACYYEVSITQRDAQAISGVIPVSPGDYFEVYLYSFDASITIVATKSWFAMEIVA